MNRPAASLLGGTALPALVAACPAPGSPFGPATAQAPQPAAPPATYATADIPGATP